MKHPRCVLFLAVLLAAPLAAAAAPVELGVHGGLSVASWIWSVGSSWDDISGSGYHPDLSVYVSIPVRSGLALQVEAGYAGRGGTIDASDGHASWDLRYVELPVLLMSTDAAGDLRMFLGGGAYAAYLLGGTYSYNVPSELQESGSLVPDGAKLPQHAARFDLGGVLTAGFGGRHVFGELRFVFGLVPVVDFALSDGIEHAASNVEVQLLVGAHL